MRSAGLISQWSDSSGGGRHFTQATGASQPTYTASAINGLPGATFDGISTHNLTFAGTRTGAFTLVVVRKLGSTTFPATLGVSAGFADGAATWAGMQYSSSPTFGPNTFAAGSTGGHSTATPALDANAHFDIVTYDGSGNADSDFTYSQDGTLFAVASGNIGGDVNTILCSVGTSPSGTYPLPSGTSICEVIRFSSVLAGASMTSLVAYLHAKFGV